MTRYGDTMHDIHVQELAPPFGIRVSDLDGPLFTVEDYDQLRTLGLTLEAIANRRQALTAGQAEQRRRAFDCARHRLPAASGFRGWQANENTGHDRRGQGTTGV